METRKKRKPPPRTTKKGSRTQGRTPVPDPRPELVEAEVVEAEVLEPEEALALWDGPRPPRKAIRDGRQLLELFLQGRSDITARNYKTDLGDFAAFVEAPNIASAIGGLCQLDNAAEAHAAILAYKAHLRRKPVYRKGAKKPYRTGYAPSTINRRLAALRSILKLGRTLGQVTWDLQVPGEKAQKYRETAGCGPQVYAKLVATLTEEIAALEASTDNLRLPGTNLGREEQIAIKMRDRALIRLMYDAALRRREPLTIDYPEDIDFDTKGRRPRVRMLGKMRGDKEWVTVPPKAAAAISAWIQRRRPGAGPLFQSFHPSHKGERLGNKAVNEMLVRVAARAGVDRVSPHQLRHSSITAALDKTNGDVRQVQKFSRHRNIQTVTIYDDQRRDVAGDIAELVSEDG